VVVVVMVVPHDDTVRIRQERKPTATAQRRTFLPSFNRDVDHDLLVAVVVVVFCVWKKCRLSIVGRVVTKISNREAIRKL
jgi:hypothetical protein